MLLSFSLFFMLWLVILTRSATDPDSLENGPLTLKSVLF